TYYGSANPELKVTINSRKCSFEPPALIVNDRVMVPLRFLVENDSIRGQVRWKAESQAVAITACGKTIELAVGSPKITVDGRFHSNLDSPPFIHMDRTYVPIRNIVEILGGQVDWNNSTREVIIQIKSKPEVFAYYYYRSFEELKANIDLFTSVAFRWFETNEKGELFYEYQDDYSDILTFCRNHGVNTHASVVLMGADPLHALLSNQKNRSRLIGNLLHEVKNNHYDGVNIDFELINPKDAEAFTTFLRELKTSLGPDYVLSVAVFARTGNENWPTPYEYREIGKIADKVIVMAYDYSYKTSAPGPIAPIWWIKQVIAYMGNNIPKEKLLLGMPTYGYDWNSSGSAVTVTQPRLLDLKKKYELKENFDNESMSPYYTYVDHKGQYHQIWLENEKSLQEKYDLAVENGWGGISFWRIGNGFHDLYAVLEKEQKDGY
ncbi:MAG: hypothetical protein GX550_06190, partial [Syntrophomonadaceae bacterium]|nr:hypothetical protein [Syntrophomonadaceae bacterium]